MVCGQWCHHPPSGPRVPAGGLFVFQESRPSCPWKWLSSLPQVQLTWVDGSWHHWLAEQGEAQDPGLQPFSAQMGKLRPRGLQSPGASVFSWSGLFGGTFPWPRSVGDVDLGWSSSPPGLSPHLCSSQADLIPAHLPAVRARGLPGPPTPAAQALLPGLSFGPHPPGGGGAL